MAAENVLKYFQNILHERNTGFLGEKKSMALNWSKPTHFLKIVAKKWPKTRGFRGLSLNLHKI